MVEIYINDEKRAQICTKDQKRIKYTNANNPTCYYEMNI